MYAATGVARETGTLDYDRLERDHIALHGQARVLPALRIAMHAAYSDASRPGGPTLLPSNIIRSGPLGRPGDLDGYRTPPDSIRKRLASIDSWRLLAGVSASWQATPWAEGRASYGVDRGKHDGGLSLDNPSTFRHVESTASRLRNSNSDIEGTARWHSGPDLAFAGTLGFERVSYRSDRTAGSNWTEAGTGGVSYGWESDMLRRQHVDGISARLGASWKERLVLNAGVRHDALTGDSGSARGATYPSVAGAWLTSLESWFHGGEVMDRLRLRVAYGEAGQPLVIDEPEAQFDQTKIEKSKEVEIGIDAGLLHDRVSLWLDYFRTTSDARVGRGMPRIRTGILRPERYSIRNSGVEAALTARLLESGSVDIDLSTIGALSRNRVVSGTNEYTMVVLAPGVSEYLTIGHPADGFVEDASFWKLREVSLGLTALERWAGSIGAKNLTLTLAARNLATWSPYSGPDPEANAAYYGSLGVYDDFGLPAERQLITRLDIGW